MEGSVVAHPPDDTALILIPGLRPPVPPRPAHLGKRCPAAGHTARRALRRAENVGATVLTLTALGVAAAIATPSGVLVGTWLIGQAAVLLVPPAVEVPSA